MTNAATRTVTYGVLAASIAIAMLPIDGSITATYAESSTEQTGVATDGGITSAATFDQRFRDVRGVNTSVARDIRMTRGVDGYWSMFD